MEGGLSELDPRVARCRLVRAGREIVDEVAVEEPLEIRVDGAPLVTLFRTPGDDLDLVAGFLFAEGVVEGRDDLAALAHLPGDPAGNTVGVTFSGGVEAHRARLRRTQREHAATSACGICGATTIAHLLARGSPRPMPTDWRPDRLRGLDQRLREAQSAFARTGGLHAAALVDAAGQLTMVREDVGRHNAVDKIVGARLRADQWPIEEWLVVSSRAGFEIVQKAFAAGISTVVALGAPTSLALALAERAGIPLVTFLRGDRFNVHGLPAPAGDGWSADSGAR